MIIADYQFCHFKQTGLQVKVGRNWNDTNKQDFQFTSSTETRTKGDISNINKFGFYGMMPTRLKKNTFLSSKSRTNKSREHNGNNKY